MLYFDNAEEYVAAANQLNIRYDTRTANRPASNGVAERCVRTVLEGTRSVLLASGLQHCYWAEASEHFAFARNITVPIRDTKKSAWQLRHGTKFKGQAIPFGALVMYLPTSDAVLDDHGKMAPRTRPGIFMGYKVQSGGCWTGVYQVMDAMAYKDGHYKSKVYVHETKECH